VSELGRKSVLGLGHPLRAETQVYVWVENKVRDNLDQYALRTWDGGFTGLDIRKYFASLPPPGSDPPQQTDDEAPQIQDRIESEHI
jgi:hypothetical protein